MSTASVISLLRGIFLQYYVICGGNKFHGWDKLRAIGGLHKGSSIPQLDIQMQAHWIRAAHVKIIEGIVDIHGLRNLPATQQIYIVLCRICGGSE